MKFLHLADLHLGRLLYGRSLIEDQQYFIRQILLPAIDTQHPDAVLIAGDVYDRQIASTEAISLFDEMIEAFSDRNLPAVIISGNHDSPERMAIGTKLLAKSGIHIITTIAGAYSPIEIGNAQIFALPYFDNAQMRAFLNDDTLRGASACMQAALERMLPLFAPDKKHILLAHCFAAGSTVSDSESRLFVGGSGDVPTDCFLPFDYVALGHLHATQKAGDTARYAGSPLKYSVDEAHQKKNLTFVTLEEKPEFEFLPILPLHDVKRISGTFETLLQSRMDEPDENYVEIELTDEAPVFRPADRLRPYYPNLLSVRNLWFSQQLSHSPTRTLRDQDKSAIFSGFLKDICDTEPQPDELELFLEIMRETEEASK